MCVIGYTQLHFNIITLYRACSGPFFILLLFLAKGVWISGSTVCTRACTCVTPGVPEAWECHDLYMEHLVNFKYFSFIVNRTVILPAGSRARLTAFRT